ncbi:sporulation initiation phosphotransferase B [Mesobacillus maritimus]|uniref:Spo0B C-terminal domain-containing protein n=1 Tax=Mesobacillus maritimus TaxID=1643336 RepID=UPI00203AD8CF|nr:Spo0B C-terminal domain-containing protein [Mesobacillus maritimus]MCM3587680.1 sporulation initiation phosphotransferase B [Mesobacillus maritimus]MCM3669925.1 sporulation initiation phosphotransferase B [Mesobacillus maritimus]
MKKEWNTIEVLKHSRHDWLNRIQLIQGNLSLNKVDRVKEIITEIIHETRQESMLTNLHLPEFAASLLTCNWNQHHFQLDYEVRNALNIHHLDDQLLASWINELFEKLDATIEPFQENYLSVSIQAGEEESIFYFDFSGILTDKESLLAFLESTVGSTMSIHVTAVSDEEVSFEIFMIPSHRVR